MWSQVLFKSIYAYWPEGLIIAWQSSSTVKHSNAKCVWCILFLCRALGLKRGWGSPCPVRVYPVRGWFMQENPSNSLGPLHIYVIVPWVSNEATGSASARLILSKRIHHVESKLNQSWSRHGRRTLEFPIWLLCTGNLPFRLQYLFAIINKISKLVSQQWR